jgi:general secretion pathway protein K
MKGRRSQRGTALIIALLVLALAAAAATAMLEAQDLQTRGLQAQRDYEQARWMLRGGMHWARSILAQDAREGTSDHQRELWASGLPPTEVQLGSLAGAIRDEQAYFNLNSLVRAGKPSLPQVVVFRRLLATIGLAPDLADAIAAAVAAAGTLSDLGELAGMPGLNAAALGKLQGYTTALPRPTPVNVNTAPPEVLAALVDGLPLSEAQALARRLAVEPVRNAAEFQARLRPDLKLNAEDISAASQFFVVQGRAQVGGADLRMQALLQRTGPAPALPAIVWQRTS